MELQYISPDVGLAVGLVGEILGMGVGAVGIIVGAVEGSLGPAVGAALQLLIHPEPLTAHILGENWML